MEKSAQRITLDQFTETTASAVIRAMDARESGLKPFGPMIFGLIWWPDESPFGRPGQPPIITGGPTQGAG